FSILRAKSLRLKPHLRPTLELESGSNDPMAYFLTITFTGLVINEQQNLWGIVPQFFLQIIVGAVMGFIMGRLSKYIINRIRLDYEGLYSVLVISLIFITYSITDHIYGNGFLAVYLLGLSLGNVQLIDKKRLVKFFDGSARLMQINLLLSLWLLVFPPQVMPVNGIGLLIPVFLILMA